MLYVFSGPVAFILTGEGGAVISEVEGIGALSPTPVIYGCMLF